MMYSHILCVVLINIVTCKGVRVSKLKCFSSDDWIYYHFGRTFSLSLNYN
jgi:hypothetical protein